MVHWFQPLVVPMSTDLIQYAYTAGEISKKYLGRSDIEKYDLAVARAHNWVVDYRGGLTTRAGTEFGDYILHDDKDVRQFSFVFAPDEANIYNLLFGHYYIRFIQNNAYVVENDIIITNISSANPGVVTATAHGLTNGDWLKLSAIVGMTELNYRTVVVANVTANTFELQDHAGVNIDTTAYTAYTSGGIINRIYTLTSPYSADDLRGLHKDQLRDTVRLTHIDYPVYNLTRITNTNWTILKESFESSSSVPTITNVTFSSTGNAGTIFAVSAVFDDDVESLVSTYYFTSGMVNYNATLGHVKVFWNAVAGAKYYNVYRSNIVDDVTVQPINAGMQMGYLGKSYGTDFIDTNIIPNFAHSPVVGNNPFADGAVEYIEITAPGTGYTNADTVSLSIGSGFQGFPVVDSTGGIVAIVIKQGGKDYTAASVVTVTGGAGMTATVNVTPATDNYPQTSVVYQQRQLYGSTRNKYLALFGSRIGLFSNFDVSGVLTPDDAYEHEIDSNVIMPIYFLIPTRGGLLVFAKRAIWKFYGSNGESITSTNAQAEIQSFVGTAQLPPLLIDADILYLDNMGTTVRLLGYNDFSKIFKGEDRSILASHLFPTGSNLVSWTYAAEPDKVVYAVRTDGSLLHFTLVKEQDVYAWCPATTCGLYKDVVSIEENDRDAVYVIVERDIGGRKTKFFERIVSRAFETVDDVWCLDSGVGLSANYPAAILKVAAETGTDILYTTDSAVFTSADVGNIIRSGKGKAIIRTYVDSKNVKCDILRNIELVNFEDCNSGPQDSLPGTWALDTPVDKLTNLWHLEGEEVSIVVDGDVLPKKVVTNGTVTFPNTITGTRAVAGLGYKCIMQTLPPVASDAIIESRTKNIIGISVRRDQTRGLKAGAKLHSLYEIKDRTDEIYGEPTRLIDGIAYAVVQGTWDLEGQTYMVQEYPLPATILGHVIRLEVGDDPR